MPKKNEKPLDDDDSQRHTIGFEDMKFLAGAALTLLGPTFLYCVVSGQYWLLYLMACIEAVGAMLGLVMFKKPSGNLLSCLLITDIPDVSSGVSCGVADDNRLLPSRACV